MWMLLKIMTWFQVVSNKGEVINCLYAKVNLNWNETQLLTDLAMSWEFHQSPFLLTSGHCMVFSRSCLYGVMLLEPPEKWPYFWYQCYVSMSILDKNTVTSSWKQTPLNLTLIENTPAEEVKCLESSYLYFSWNTVMFMWFCWMLIQS